MFKKIVLLSVTLMILAHISAFAGGSGNCIEPLKTTTDKYGVGAAFGYNYVNGRLMHLYNYNKDEENISVNKLSQVYGQVPIGLSDTMNLFLRVGSANYDLQFKVKGTDQIVDVELDNGIYAGGGMNALYPLTEVELNKIGKVAIGVGYSLQANGYMNNVKSVTRAGEGATSEDGGLYGVDGEESIYVTCKYDMEQIKTSLVPYIGVYHSWIVIGMYDDLSYQRASQKNRDESSDIQGAFDVLSFGLLLGLDVNITKYATLNIEGRFIGETAITTGATVKF